MKLEELYEKLSKCEDNNDYFFAMNDWLSSLTVEDFKIGKIKYTTYLYGDIHTFCTITIQGITIENNVNYRFSNNDSSFKKIIMVNILSNLTEAISNSILKTIKNRKNKYLLDETFYIVRNRILNRIDEYNITHEFYSALKLRLDKIYSSDKYKNSVNIKCEKYIQSKVSKMFIKFIDTINSSSPSYTENDIEASIIKALRRTRIERILK